MGVAPLQTFVPTSFLSRSALTLLAGAVYFLSSRLAYELAIPGGVVTLWLPTGVMLGLLLMRPRHDWPMLLAGAVAGSVASDALQGYPPGFVAAAALANALQCAGIAWAISSRIPTPVTITTARQAMALSAFVIGGTAIFAVLGGAVMALWFPRSFLNAWLVWWAGDGLGALVVMPAMLVWRGTGPWLITRKRSVLLQGAGLFVGLVIVSEAVLGTSSVWSQPYMVLPFVYLLTIRLGLRGAALASLTVAIVATWNAALGQGPFIANSPSVIQSAMRLYVYIAFASLTTFLAAAVLAERLAVKKQLLSYQQRTEFALDAAKVGVWEVNLRTGEAFWSRTCEVIHGLAPGAFAGTFDAFLARVHAADVSKVAADVKSAVDNHAEAILEYRVPLGEGRERLVRSIGRFFYDDQGMPVRGAGVAIDVTEQRDLENQLRQSRKMDVLGQLAAGVAHDFNNILTVIQGYATLVQQQCPPGSTVKEDVDELLLGVQRAEGLTRQLLAFSRRQILAPKVFDLAALVSGMQPMLRRLLGEHVTIRVNAVPGVAFVRADPGQIEQVVMNLAVNARDAMPSGGSLEMRVFIRDCEVVLVVDDSGIGMSKVILDHIFEPFYTTKQAGKGTGLGLATVQGIVQQSGGRIEVESTVGKGSTFTVTLPLEQPIAQSNGAAARSSGEGRGETILVVEDDLELRRMAQRILREAGYVVLTSGSSEEALRSARDMPRLDLLLTDVVLPGMNGRALADVMRQDRPGIPVLYMSGYTDDEVMLRGVMNQGMSLVQKPFDPITLRERVREMLDRGT